jgi:hypothetical protein
VNSMKRWCTNVLAMIVMLSLVNGQLRADAAIGSRKPFTAHDVLEGSRKASQSVTVTLTNGEVIVGSIVRVDKSRCVIHSSSQGRLREVRYSELEAVQTNDAAYQVQPQYGQGVRPSLRAWIWIGIAIGAVFVFVFASGLNRD